MAIEVQSSVSGNVPIANTVGGGAAFSRKPLPPTPVDNVKQPVATRGGGSNHVGYPKTTQYSGQVTISNEQIRRGNPHISSYSHHNLGGGEPQPPLPVGVVYM